MEIRPLPEWQTLLDRASERPGTVLVLGAVDSGKSTLCRWLLRALAAAGRPGLLLDADVGQSASGLPAAVNLSQVREDGGVTRKASAFVGSVTPQGHLVQDLAAIALLARTGAGAERLVVDTTGFVHGHDAWQLKLRKAQVLLPRIVAGVQADGEVEHLLAPHEGSSEIEVLRLPVSPEVKRRSPEQRKAYRESCFRAALEGATEWRLRLGEVKVRGMGLGAGRPLAAAEQAALSTRLGCEVWYAEVSREGLTVVTQGVICVTDLGQAREELRAESCTTIDVLTLRSRLVGLIGPGGLLHALGSLERVERGGEAVVRAKLPEGADVRCIDIGGLRVSPTGEELG